MNRIVCEHYPVADLPEKLQEMVPDVQHVRLVIEPASTDGSDADHGEPALTPPERVLSLEELFAMRRPPYRTTDEIVEDIRRQREEWDY